MSAASASSGARLNRLLGLDAPSRAARTARALLAAAVIGCGVFVVLNLVVAPLTGHFAGWFEDFGPLLSAGDALNGGRDPYGDFVVRAPNSLVTDLGFDYLPLVAWLFRPLAAMPHDAAMLLWIVVTLSCTIAGSIVVAREVLPRTWPSTAIGFCVAVLFQPAIYNVWHGQMNAVVFLFVALALRSWMRGDEVACGVFLGLGVSAKVAPAVLLLLLVRRGWWRGIAAGCLTVVASLVAGGALAGFDRVGEWFTQVLPVLGREDGWYFNQGWNAVVNRLADHDVYRVDGPSTLIHAAVLGLSGASVLGAAWLVGREASPERRSLEFATGVTAMVLAGTISWYSAYIHLTLPLLVVAGIAVRHRADRVLLAAGALATVVAGVAAPLFLAGGGKDWVVGLHGTAGWWPALQVVSLPAFAAAFLLLALLRTAAARPWSPGVGSRG